jgi:hypothetical protein
MPPDAALALAGGHPAFPPYALIVFRDAFGKVRDKPGHERKRGIGSPE